MAYSQIDLGNGSYVAFEKMNLCSININRDSSNQCSVVAAQFSIVTALYRCSFRVPRGVQVVFPRLTNGFAS